MGTGSGGADESILQSLSLDMSTFGFGMQLGSGNRLADDFTIASPAGWFISQVTVFAYQTGTGTTSTISGANLRIWNGPPDESGSVVIWGNTSTNILASTGWTNSYRVSQTTTGVSTDRPIMYANLAINVLLPPGTYWLDYQLNGNGSFSGPWAPPIPLNGRSTTGNSLQFFNGAWNPTFDDATGSQQGFPFLIEGSFNSANGLDNINTPRRIVKLAHQNQATTATASTSGNDPMYPCGSGNQGSHSVWYRFQSPDPVSVMADTFGSNYDTMLAVWTGTPGNLTNVACNDDAEGTLQSKAFFTAQANTNYYVEVASYNTSPGGNLLLSLTESDLWSYIGPKQSAIDINDIVVDSNNPNIVYATTVQGVYKSTDGGETWGAKINGLGTFGGLEVTNLAIDPTNSQILFISTWGDGVYKSTDGGDNWVLLSDPVTRSVRQLVAGETVHGGGHTSQNPAVSLESLDKSVDTLEQLQTVHDTTIQAEIQASEFPPEDLDFTPARSLAIHPSNPNRLIVAVSGRGHYLTQDGGNNWSLLSMPGASLSSGRAIAFAPSNANIAYASRGDWGSNGGIFRSSDGGQSWSLVAGNATITSVVTNFAIDPANPNRLLAATYGQGMWLSTNGGASWAPSNSGITDNSLLNVAISPVNSNLVFATSYLWIWKSIDGGVNWSISDPLYPDFNTWALELHPTDSSILFVGARLALFGSTLFGHGVQRSANGGASFDPKNSGMENTYVLDIEDDPLDPNRMYAGMWGAGVYATEDGGISWVQRNAGMSLPFVYSIEATQGVTGTVLYAGTFYCCDAVFVSYDEGQSWSDLPTTGLPGFGLNVFDIVSIDGSSTNLLVATSDGIYRSTNSGQSWSNTPLGSTPTSGIILEIKRVPSIAGRFLAATFGDGIYYSNNGGVSWSAASGESSDFVFGLAPSPYSSSEIYAATLGLNRSQNGGISWSNVQSGVPANLFFRSIEYSLDGNADIFAGSIGQGMWVAPAGNDVWLPFSDNFAPPRVRTVNAQLVHPFRIVATTDGQSSYVFAPYNLPQINSNYLPIGVRE